MQEEFDVGSKSKDESGCHISWNPSSFDPPSLAVGNYEGTIKIFQFNDNTRKWSSVDLCSGNDRHTDAIHDICWAPNLGRSYHLIASASKDKTVRIWKVELDASGKWKGKLQEKFNEHNSEVWRVQWNITGTILASSGDDGNVRLYQSDHTNSSWKCVQTISADKN